MSVVKFSPILLFTYNRLKETKITIEALQENIGASESDLFIFSDAPKNKEAIESVHSVREYLKTISGFKSINVIERNKNYGLATSIISGVSEIIERYGSVIVLEDDLITSPNFLSYMNKALQTYESNSKIWSISGFSFPISAPEGYEYDALFGIRSTSWGWATWKNRWEKVDWEVSDYKEFLKNKKARKAFKQGGSDLCKMLNDQMTGKINSWAIRFCYAQFKNQCFDLYPTQSKVMSIGFAGDATHTKGMEKRFETQVDQTDKRDFSFPTKVEIIPSVLAQFQSYFSIYTRLKYKILRFF